MTHPSRTRRSAIAGLTVAALVTAVAAVVTAVAPTAAAADTTTLNIININDFHGRIDANTVKWAATVEQIRAQDPANTLFVSGGDNVSASLFASAVQNDQPTIDVLNEVGLQDSAVGNHEFDKGYSDLVDRIIGPAGSPNATWDYLGANVTQAGTDTPALPPFDVRVINGIRVGIIGAVTAETPSLVSPGGITAVSFGDPVAAINKYADQLTDGNDANGEADVLIATYHEGAAVGEFAPPAVSSTLDAEVAKGGAFAEIVNDTSPKVSAIITGHTHQKYAWSAPIPGRPGEVRPVVQTGSYGDNVGNIKLTVDNATKQVVSSTQTNVARLTTDDATLIATYPVLGQVQDTVTKALAYAADVGNQQVATVTADVTTAFAGGGYTGPGGTYVGGARDDRASESTLGNLVADALLDSLAPTDRGGAEIGVVNPGGLRAELTYAPDGSITYAEANSVLPFVNNLWTTTLTGAQVKTMLEQQWQRDATGNVPTRPYLQLGLSKNITYTYDATRAEGDRITSITVNGAPIDPARGYRVGTFSFLTTGGDNFRVVAQGADARDSGLVDRDAWIAYLSAHSPITPVFAKHAVQVSGNPAGADRGQSISLQVSGLDLTSLGAPANTGLTVTLGGATLGKVAVTGGAAAVTVTIPFSATPGPSQLILTAAPSGTVVTIPITITATVATTTAVTLSAPAQTYGGTPVTASVTVSAADGSVPTTGTVTVTAGAVTVCAVPWAGAAVSCALPATLPAGTVPVVAAYSGDGPVQPSQSAPVPLTVTPAASSSILLPSAFVLKFGAGTATLWSLSIQAPAIPGTGTLTIRDGATVVATVPVVNGLASWAVPATTTIGVHWFSAVFTPASADYAPSTSNSVPVIVLSRWWW